MSYIVEQQVGNHVYLYEVESYWDPAKKQPRQRREYLGRKDPRWRGSRRAAALVLNAAWRVARRLFTLSAGGRGGDAAAPGWVLIHLTNDPALDREAVLQLYARRDRVEKRFDVLKNELGEDRLRGSFREAMEGRIFLAFLALIVHTLLDNAMRRADRFRSLTIAEVLAELRKLRRVEMSSGRAYLMEITKKQRTIYDQLNIPIPPVTWLQDPGF